jgi:soluble lytic murein transglycosylase
MSSAMMPKHGQVSPNPARSRRMAALLLVALTGLSAPAQCQDGAEWDRARSELKASAPGAIAPAIARWRQLAGTENQGFDAYAGFVLAWSGFPLEEAMRRAAEKSLALENVDSARIVALFDRFPPLTNPARGAYALALSAQGRERDAADMARAAWRGGVMTDAAEAAILARWGQRFSADDHDARLEALLWDGAVAQAIRALGRASPARLAVAKARLALLQGLPDSPPLDPATPSPEGDAITPALSDAAPELAPEALRDPGYLADRARYFLRHGRGADAASLLASRPALARPALDTRRWAAVTLAAAKAGGPTDALRIATGALEGFAPGADISQFPFGVRDDYTSLMWIGGTSALFQLRDPDAAALLFYRYGTAARTPMTRSKGFYWAGRALAQAGRESEAKRYFEQAAQYPNQYYGLLALERLARPVPPLHDASRSAPTDAQRAQFASRPITQAVREVARDTEWQVAIRFFREIANQAKTEADFVAVAELARSIGRRDLAVIAGQAAENAGFANFRDLSYPLIPTPEGANWTYVHAIARQESQFSQNAISRTAARGLMQLMPATAAEMARKLGLPVSVSALSDDPMYNLTVGNAYFMRLLNAYHGSYPLAVAAYNAGPGRVNQWLASRGDPRQGELDWVEWIERIPISETRNYVTHVLENAVTYEAMNPDKAAYKGANPLSYYIGKDKPG